MQLQKYSQNPSFLFLENYRKKRVADYIVVASSLYPLHACWAPFEVILEQSPHFSLLQLQEQRQKIHDKQHVANVETR